jgi:hypothetical protein
MDLIPQFALESFIFVPETGSCIFDCTVSDIVVISSMKLATNEQKRAKLLGREWKGMIP